MIAMSSWWIDNKYYQALGYKVASQVVLVLKNLPANAGDIKDSSLVIWQFYFQFFKKSPHCSP